MSDSDSDAPEEFTAEQAIEQDEVIRKVQKENKARVARESKERRRQWAQRKTPRQSKKDEKVEDVIETETDKEESLSTAGMLPDHIVQQLVAREKKVFLSDSEDEKVDAKLPPRKKKPKTSGMETIILNDSSSPPCLANSLEFLKKKKMQISRSSAVLNNSNQALRLISTSGLLSKK